MDHEISMEDKNQDKSEQHKNKGMAKRRVVREVLILSVTCLALYNAGRAICDSVNRQFFLHDQAIALKRGQAQAEQVNKELREGLSNYRSSKGIERLARERLNQAGPDEVIVHIGK
jgi:cell division protein FtsB